MNGELIAVVLHRTTPEIENALIFRREFKPTNPELYADDRIIIAKSDDEL
jgi:hypothetical protein